MIDDSPLAQARAAIDHERAAAGAKADAFEAFLDRVSDLSTTGQPAAPGARSQSGGSVAAPTSTGSSCRAVRAAFAETVRPESVADVDDSEPLLATVRAELNDHVASALSQSSDAEFSPSLKEAVLRGSAARLGEIRAFRDLLATEREHLEDTQPFVADVTEWVESADQTPLPEAEFRDLVTRDERLDGYREQCRTALTARQEFLDEQTCRQGVTLSHNDTLKFIYQGLDVWHPALDVLVDLESVCCDCQRRVREHATIRV
jgi:hypothetical protein